MEQIKMSDLEKMIKVNSLLILIANYNADKSIETNEFFRASAYELLFDLGLVSPGEGAYKYKVHAEIYRLHVEVNRILSEDSSYKLISEIGLMGKLGFFTELLGNFVEEISRVEDNTYMFEYASTYSRRKAQIEKRHRQVAVQQDQ